MNSRRPTLADVAQRAGVSYATADRVVNGRGGVSEKTVRNVRTAVSDLNYVRNVAAANLSQQRYYRFAAVLPEGTNAFFARMRALLGAAAERLLVDRVNLTIETVAAFDPGALRDRLESLAAEGVDGIALVGSDDVSTVDAIAALRDGGIPVLTLVSEVPGSNRAAYVGIDNTVAGSTVARLITLAHGGRSGRILPIVGGLSARDHADRMQGLRNTVPSQITLAPVIEGRDRSDLVETFVADALKADPSITAIYSAGGGNSGLVRVLKSLPQDRPRPIVVLHELVANTRSALEQDLIDIIIDQRPEEEVARVIESLRLLADRRDPLMTDPIVPTIYVRENLPQDTQSTQAGEPPK
ncbi:MULTISPECIES: LacI family DNA-binding transcriptional regulator [Roseobacteraceae]|jgi:LacI family transcriptional regulator|uniref:HTH-type transcriptional regulator DegA n=1 Tax=Pseudosulfitobacter pseudonitzschiae TaxID=1402135 RepID=A0A221K1C2_9RHOB|nr:MULTISPECIES: LacI family DNA-binding transcriptional regulator [Roseobacteraceae]ASM72769.1 HTH-type transcriptional regulator DegA [Pseudosulfitobacter pseudonitzschiae]